MDHKEVGLGGKDWIDLADRDSLRALVNAEMNRRGP
jgi:hypothetical protein